MNKSKATSMGFKPTPMLDRKNMLQREWRRDLKRPCCHEIWSPDRPNQITRYRHLSAYATSIEVRAA